MDNTKERDIILKDIKYFNKYWNLFKEVGARAEGTKNAEVYRQKSRYTLSKTSGTKQADNGTWKERYLGPNSRNSSTEGEYSIEPSDYKQVENTQQDEIKIEKSGKDKIYDWHADIETKRFDVNKTLQSTINISNSLAKEFSKSKGIKNLSGKTVFTI